MGEIAHNEVLDVLECRDLRGGNVRGREKKFRVGLLVNERGLCSLKVPFYLSLFLEDH